MAVHTGDKTIAVVPQGQTDNPRIIRIRPGTTVSQALQLAGLPADVSLTSPLGGGLMDGSENLYETVKDGDKVSATASFTAGGA
jgi:hypothetical protein